MKEKRGSIERLVDLPEESAELLEFGVGEGAEDGVDARIVVLKHPIHDGEPLGREVDRVRAAVGVTAQEAAILEPVHMLGNVPLRHVEAVGAVLLARPVVDTGLDEHVELAAAEAGRLDRPRDVAAGLLDDANEPDPREEDGVALAATEEGTHCSCLGLNYQHQH